MAGLLNNTRNGRRWLCKDDLFYLELITNRDIFFGKSSLGEPVNVPYPR